MEQVLKFRPALLNGILSDGIVLERDQNVDRSNVGAMNAELFRICIL